MPGIVSFYNHITPVFYFRNKSDIQEGKDEYASSKFSFDNHRLKIFDYSRYESDYIPDGK